MYMDGGVSHVRPPAAPLLFGDIEAFVQWRFDAAVDALGPFDVTGVKVYRPGEIDYGKTHFANHANGYGAANLMSLLEGAALSADPELIEVALDLLDKQTSLYANTVPRGAQTWEIPLHTPDILTSGRLVRAYVLGHIITGRQDYLEQARYWAWSLLHTCVRMGGPNTLRNRMAIRTPGRSCAERFIGSSCLRRRRRTPDNRRRWTGHDSDRQTDTVTATRTSNRLFFRSYNPDTPWSVD